MKSGKLNFLEPSGPLQACNWTALAFAILHYDVSVCYVSVSWCILVQFDVSNDKYWVPDIEIVLDCT